MQARICSIEINMLAVCMVCGESLLPINNDNHKGNGLENVIVISRYYTVVMQNFVLLLHQLIHTVRKKHKNKPNDETDEGKSKWCLKM